MSGMKSNPYFDALAEGCDFDGPLTKSNKSYIAKFANEIREVCDDPAEIPRRIEVYRSLFPDCPVTPSALAKHWGRLKPAKEDEWTMVNRIAREKGLEPFRGHPYETKEQFITRVTNSNVVQINAK